MSDKKKIIESVKRLLKEDLEIYTIGIFIKTSKKVISKRDLGNKLRAVPSVLTVKPLDDERLNRISDDDDEFNYIVLKYISTHKSPSEDLAYIKSYISNGQEDVNLEKIPGVLKMDFRLHTLEKQ